MVRSVQGSTLPVGWKYDHLDKFTVRGSGHTPNKEKSSYWNGGIKWVSLTDSSKLDKGFIFKTDKEISEEGIRNSSAVLHPAGTVILSRDAGVGKSAVLASPMAVSQHFMAWRCDNSEKMNSWFLYNWLQLMKPEFERQAAGSTIKTIGLPYFKKLKIATPPYAEQEKIAKVISAWDQAIVVTENLLEKSQQMKAALIQQLITGTRRLPHYTEPRQKVKLGSLLKEEKSRNSNNSVSQVLSVTNHSGFVLPEDQFSKRVASDDVRNYKIVRRGQFGYNPSRINVGSLARLDSYEVGLLSPMYVVFSLDQSQLNSDFFMFWMESNEAKQRIRSSTQGSVRDSVSFDKLAGFAFKLPCLDEQKAVAEIITIAHREIQILQAKIICLKQEKKALLQELLTGKRRVTVDAKEAM